MEKLLDLLKKYHLSLGSVESMTGGMFAAAVTDVPGASEVFKGSIVAYAKDIKYGVVGVHPETIEKYGVVSEQVAYEMARYGREKLAVDICVAVTGNAGPTAEPGGKKVGVFYVAVATCDGVYIEYYKKSGKRNDIRNKAVLAMRDDVYLKLI